MVTLGCNIHDWMIAYILVVSTPHFARTDARGVARMRDLPAGSYELQAWHPQQRARRRGPRASALEAAAQHARRVSRSTSRRASPATSRRSTG